MLKNGTRNRNLLFWSVVVGLHLFYFGYELSHDRLYLSDSYEYLSVASSIVHSGTTSAGTVSQALDDPGLFTKRPPLYPLLLAATGAVSGAEWLTLLAQNILSLFGIFLILRTYRLLGFSPKYRLLLLVLLLAYPAQFIYANIIMSEIMLQAVVVSMAFILAKFSHQKKVSYIVVYNVLIILAFMTKPAFYLLVLPNIALMVYWSIRYNNRLFRYIGAAPLIIVIIYCSWNMDRTGYFHFSSIQNEALLHYNAYQTLLRKEGPEEAEAHIDSVAATADQTSSFAAKQRLMQKGALDVIKAHPRTYTQLHAGGIVHFFLDPGRFDLYQFFGLSDGSSRGLLFHFGRNGYSGIWNYLRRQNPAIVAILLVVALLNVLKAFSILIFTIDRTIPAEIKWSFLLLVGYVAFVTGPLGASRFAMPVFPVLAVIAAFAVRYVVRRYDARKISLPRSYLK